MSDEEDIVAHRNLRRPRSEVQKLLNLCYEDSVDLSPGDLGGNPWRVSQALETRRNAFPLCGAAHIASLRNLDHKLLALYTVRVPPECGMRTPNMNELQAADKLVWTDFIR